MCDEKPPEYVVSDALYRVAQQLEQRLRDGHPDEPVRTSEMAKLLRQIADEVYPTT